jgi:Glutaminase
MAASFPTPRPPQRDWRRRRYRIRSRTGDDTGDQQGTNYSCGWLQQLASGRTLIWITARSTLQTIPGVQISTSIYTSSGLAPGSTVEGKWQFIHDGLSRFAGRQLPLNEEVYASASETNYRNQSVSRLLQSYGRIYTDPAQATDLYTKQCSLNVSARDLAVMGATLADGG